MYVVNGGGNNTKYHTDLNPEIIKSKASIIDVKIYLIIKNSNENIILEYDRYFIDINELLKILNEDFFNKDPKNSKLQYTKIEFLELLITLHDGKLETNGVKVNNSIIRHTNEYNFVKSHRTDKFNTKILKHYVEVGNIHGN